MFSPSTDKRSLHHPAFISWVIAVRGTCTASITALLGNKEETKPSSEGPGLKNTPLTFAIYTAYYLFHLSGELSTFITVNTVYYQPESVSFVLSAVHKGKIRISV